MTARWSRRRFLVYGGLGAAGAAVWATVGLQRYAHAAPAPATGPLALGSRRFAHGDATAVRLVGLDPAHPEPEAWRAAWTAALDTPAARRLARRIRTDVAEGRPARVLVKPAVNSGNAYPFTASARSVHAVCAWLGGLGATVIVADMSGPGANTLASLESTGLTRAARDGGATRILDFGSLPRQERWRTFSPPEATSFPRGFQLTALLQDVDYVINVARVSTHSLTDTTLSLKNWQGLVGWPTRRYTHTLGPLADCMAEYSLAVKPDLVVLDAGTVVTTKGPNKGLAVPVGALIVAEDMVAADLVGLALLRYASNTLDAQSRKDRPSWIEDPGASLWRAPVIGRAVALEVGVFEREHLLLDPHAVPDPLRDGVLRALDA